jgi:DNA sulfur modification protein DndD
MLITRIKATNYKTYLELDVALETSPDHPIVLIGGANGGGKTTFFDAIYGALYGLEIPNKKVFTELLNAGAPESTDQEIKLELHFRGKVLNEDKNYVLTRRYQLNPAGKPVESVHLNMDGNIFRYGTATPAAERNKQEQQVNKIIKSNLPEELSRYFLFDAMEAGNLLKDNRLNRVIRENIENVMGFNRYLGLAAASASVTEEYTAKRLKVEKEKKEYLNLIDQRKQLQQKLKEMQEKYQKALDYSTQQQELYEKLKAGQNQEKTISNKIKQLEDQLSAIAEKEKSYGRDMQTFVNNFEKHIVLPKLYKAFRNEISAILKERKQTEQHVLNRLNKYDVEELLQASLKQLQRSGYDLSNVAIPELAEQVMQEIKQEGSIPERYSFLNEQEIKALETLVSDAYQNPLLDLRTRKIELENDLQVRQRNEEQKKEYEQQISGEDYTLIEKYENNEQQLREFDERIHQLKQDLNDLNSEIQEYDLPNNEEPDPKYETLKKLQPLFEKIANTLLKTKKEQIQSKMKQDLNENLEAYRDVISKVELSEDLRDLSFKIYHVSGNEIYLNQLNTASKQVVVQVLLKALHEYGDYNPPVMIDTVMGVLDVKSRATLLKNYFPEVSHQTILLSSDSEIRPESDFPELQKFISKTYTLERDRKLQKTEVRDGYFGRQL